MAIWRSLCMCFLLFSACSLESANEVNDSPKGKASTETEARVPTLAEDAISTDTFWGSDVRDEKMGTVFSLPSTLGREFTKQDLMGRVSVLIFGYTHCPDVCPTHLLTYANVLNQLGSRAEAVQVLFITLDPERDTKNVLSTYLPLFHSDFIGLIARDEAELNHILAAWKISAEKMPYKEGQYLIDHSAGTYILDKDGNTRLYEPYGQTEKQLFHDINLLLE